MLGRLVSHSISRILPTAQRFAHFRKMSVFNASRLQNKTVLITGASGGIGEVIILLNDLMDRIPTDGTVLFERQPRYYLQRLARISLANYLGPSVTFHLPGGIQYHSSCPPNRGPGQGQSCMRISSQGLGSSNRRKVRCHQTRCQRQECCCKSLERYSPGIARCGHPR
jgi:hypothetical protein